MSGFDLAAAVAYNDRNVDYRLPESAGIIAKLVAAYQAEHGLVVDGKLGPATRALLARPQAEPSVIVEPALHQPAVTSDIERAGRRRIVTDRMTAASLETCYYSLSAGGNAKAKDWPYWPWNESRQADCSAVACWALGFARNNGDWNTTKILRDAIRRDGRNGPQTRFAPRRHPSEVRPGDILVKDGIFDPKTGKRIQPGHIGIAMKIPAGFDWNDPDWWMSAMIGHCSPSNSAPPPKGRGVGHAIAITDARAWRNAKDLDFDGDVDYADNVKWWASNNVAFLTYLPLDA